MLIQVQTLPLEGPRILRVFDIHCLHLMSLSLGNKNQRGCLTGTDMWLKIMDI